VKQVFPIAATAGAGTALSVFLVVIIVVPVLAVAWYLLSAPRAVRFEVTPEGLRIRGDLFYSRFIPRGELILDQARPMDLTAEPEYKAKWRTNGTGMPGYKAGWFKLQNGQKALLFVGDSQRLVLIPVRSGYSLLVSVAKPEEFLATLRNAGLYGTHK
jgi:hypothetical protein